MGILFVDFTKAFDTVSHNILLQKLNDLGIRGDIWLWLKNYLTERRQFVRINGCDSVTHTITQGVPQESVLRPTLFSLFTNDLPKTQRSAETYLYADDTTIYCIVETMDLLTNTLNNVRAELQEWCDRNSTFTGPVSSSSSWQHHHKERPIALLTLKTFGEHNGEVSLFLLMALIIVVG